MALTVLSIAHPLAPVGDRAVGGAEQVLTALDRALTREGHRSLVLACETSQVCGELLPIPLAEPPYDDAAKAQALLQARAMLATAAHGHVDVVHIHAVEFHRLLPAAGIPTLVTLHLPREFYAASAFEQRRSTTWFNCVSRSEHAKYRDLGAQLLPPIENGVEIVPYASPVRENYVLVLSRLCAEKGIHLAIDAAEKAGTPLLIAGRVFPYPEHERYFQQQIVPRLGPQCRFLGAVHGAQKQQLIARARCVLVPSLVGETSSLTARETLACGTPVVAFDRGALRETVSQGVTGFLVKDVDGMACAIAACDRIHPLACMRAAQTRFSLERMVADYLAVYGRLAAPPARHLFAPPQLTRRAPPDRVRWHGPL